MAAVAAAATAVSTQSGWGLRVEAEEAVHLGEPPTAARVCAAARSGRPSSWSAAFLLGSRLILCSTACLMGSPAPWVQAAATRSLSWRVTAAEWRPLAFKLIHGLTNCKQISHEKQVESRAEQT